MPKSITQTIIDTAGLVKDLETSLEVERSRIIDLATQLTNSSEDAAKLRQSLSDVEISRAADRATIEDFRNKLNTAEEQNRALIGQLDIAMKELNKWQKGEYRWVGGTSKELSDAHAKIDQLTELLAKAENRAAVLNTIDPADYINELASSMYSIAEEHGFHEGDEKFLTVAELVDARMSTYVANIHGEVSELWEAFRKDAWWKPCDKQINGISIGLTWAEEELADIVIRCMDTAWAMNIKLGKAIQTKANYNEQRSYKHGGKKA